MHYKFLMVDNFNTNLKINILSFLKFHMRITNVQQFIFFQRYETSTH